MSESRINDGFFVPTLLLSDLDLFYYISRDFFKNDSKNDSTFDST